MSADTLQTLQTTAIALAALSGLFGERAYYSCCCTAVLTPANITGVYFVLFVLAVWSTYRQTTSAAKKLRLVTVLLYVQLLILLCCVLPVFMYSFLVLLTHFITRSLEFSRARLQIDTDREMYRWSIPLTFLGK